MLGYKSFFSVFAIRAVGSNQDSNPARGLHQILSQEDDSSTTLEAYFTINHPCVAGSPGHCTVMLKTC